MKRALCLMSLILVMGFSVTAFAAATNVRITFGTGGLTGISACEYGLSNNVYMDYANDNNYQAYKLGSKHKAGNREYYTTNNTSQIYYWESDTYKGETLLDKFSGVSAGAEKIDGGTAL